MRPSVYLRIEYVMDRSFKRFVETFTVQSAIAHNLSMKRIRHGYHRAQKPNIIRLKINFKITTNKILFLASESQHKNIELKCSYKTK